MTEIKIIAVFEVSLKDTNEFVIQSASDAMVMQVDLPLRNLK